MGGFKGKKVFGSYKTDICPFCGKTAYAVNKAKIPVCTDHKNTEYPELRCICGRWLEVRAGKFGTYCNCLKCGNISLAKAFEYQAMAPPIKKTTITENKTTSNSSNPGQKFTEHLKDIRNLKSIIINNEYNADNSKENNSLNTNKKRFSEDKIQAEIDKARKESLIDPVEKKCKETGLKSWKDL